MTNPYKASGDQSRSASPTPSERNTTRITLVCNFSFLALLCSLIASVAYVLETEGGGIRFVEVGIFPIGILAIVAFMLAMFYNFKVGNWVWAMLISPFGLFLMFYMAMLIAGQF